MIEYTFEKMFKRYLRRCVLFATGYIMRQDAEDVVMEIFEKLWESWENFPDEQKVKAFLYISIRNKCLDRIRRAKRMTNVSLANFEIAEQSRYNEMDRKVLTRLNQHMETLPEGRRKIMRLLMTGLDSVQTARQMGTSNENVRVAKFYAIKQLRASMNSSEAKLLYFQSFQ